MLGNVQDLSDQPFKLRIDKISSEYGSTSKFPKINPTEFLQDKLHA